MPEAKYRYVGEDSERRKECLGIVSNFELLKRSPALVKDDVKSSLVRVGVGEGDVFCKRFAHGGVLNCIKNQLRRSKANRSYTAAKRAQELGISVPEHLAAIEKRVRGVLVESFLITRAVEEAVPLQRFVKERFPQEKEASVIHSKRDFIRGAADFLSRVHSKGMEHNDLKGANIIVRPVEDRYEFYVLDLDCALFRKQVSMSAIVRNLVQLNNDCMYVAGQFDRLRFFIYYLKKMGFDLSRSERRSLAERVARLTQEKVDRWYREQSKLERKGKSKHLDESINLGG
jgi:tRNA A-37 threonylcarbamoyl transferase component Bud32